MKHIKILIFATVVAALSFLWLYRQKDTDLDGAMRAIEVDSSSTLRSQNLAAQPTAQLSVSQKTTEVAKQSEGEKNYFHVSEKGKLLQESFSLHSKAEASQLKKFAQMMQSLKAHPKESLQAIEKTLQQLPLEQQNERQFLVNLTAQIEGEDDQRFTILAKEISSYQVIVDSKTNQPVRNILPSSLVALESMLGFNLLPAQRVLQKEIVKKALEETYTQRAERKRILQIYAQYDLKAALEFQELFQI